MIKIEDIKVVKFDDIKAVGFEDIKVVIRNGKSQRDRQCNGQTKTDKKISNDLHNTKNSILSNTNPNINRVGLRCSGMLSSFCFISGTSRNTDKRYVHHVL